MDKKENRNSKIFFTENYLNKNNKIKDKDLQKIACYAFNRLIKRTLFSVITFEQLK